MARIKAEKEQEYCSFDLMYGGSLANYVANKDLFQDYYSSEDDKLMEAYRNTLGFCTNYTVDGSVLLVNDDLLKELGGTIARSLDRQLLYELITCPVDVKNEQLVMYWLESVIAISVGAEPEVPMFNTDTLEGCELQYKALDVRHQLLRRIGVEDPRMDEKLELCEKINQLLLTDEGKFRRRCRKCGRPLPIGSTFGICDRCFHAGRRRHYHRR